MANYLSPTGNPIIGTLERLAGVANLTGIDPVTQEPEYSGGTTVWWDEQKTVERDGKTVFVDQEGGEWTFDQLVLDEVEDEEAA